MTHVDGERAGPVAAGPPPPTSVEPPVEPVVPEPPVEPVVPEPAGAAPAPPGRLDADRLQDVLDRLRRCPPGGPEHARLRDEAIVGALPLARHAARRFRTARIADGDLVQVAALGLIKAVDRYDPDRGIPFVGYAMPTVLGELRHHVRDCGWGLRPPRSVQERVRQVQDAVDELAQQLGRIPRPSDVAEHLGLDPEEVLDALAADQATRTLSLDVPLTDGSEPADDAAGGHAAVEDRHTVASLLARLTPADRRIVELRFFDGLSQARIADEIGYSQMYVSRALARILRGLRDGVREVVAG